MNITRTIIMAGLLLTPLCTMAQSETEGEYATIGRSRSDKNTAFAADTAQTGRDKGVFYTIIPPKLNIKDKVIVQNRSPYFIVQMVVAVDYAGNGDYVPLGQASYVPTGQAVTIASFDDNKLKRLRGKRLMFKVKGAKINPTSSGAQVDVYTPFGSVNVNNRQVDQEMIRHLDPKTFTYDFRARLFEADHDLYIQVEGVDMLDF